MNLPLPCYSCEALSIPFLLFPFHFIHCLSRYSLIARGTASLILIQEIFLSQKNLYGVYIHTCIYIFIYTRIYTWNLSEHFFPNIHVPNVTLNIPLCINYCFDVQSYIYIGSMASYAYALAHVFIPCLDTRPWDAFVCLIVIVFLAIWSSEVNFSICAARMIGKTKYYLHKQ